VNAPGRPTIMTFFPAQYSATLIMSGSGNPLITFTEGILEGAANAKVAPAKDAPDTAWTPIAAATAIFMTRFILPVYQGLCA